MNRITKAIVFIAASIISLDVILMVINGTMLYVILTISGFYLIASLAFKQWAYKVVQNWIQSNGNHLKGNQEHDKFSRTN